MKNLIIVVLLVSASILSLVSCTPKYDTNQALSYIWNETQDNSEFPHGSIDIKRGDTTFHYYASINHNPSWNRYVLTIRISIPKKILYEVWVESLTGSWMKEEENGVYSRESTLTLDYLTLGDEEVIKRAYNVFTNR